MSWKEKASYEFIKLLDVIEKLRDPITGCPWDIKQTPYSLRSDLLEETHEVINAIDEEDSTHINEELGDNLFVLMIIGYMYQQESKFNISSLIKNASDKLIRRHPHVFGNNESITNANDVIKQWEAIKVDVEGRKPKDSILDKVKSFLPSLKRAYKTQKTVAKVGFDWKNNDEVWDKLYEEIDELKQGISNNDNANIEEELGDLLFTVVNLSRKLNIDPELALNKSTEKFHTRFKFIEEKFKELQLDLNERNFSTMDSLWNESKNQ
ncbi:nucleoside triphosphate pyrophosphohydrolase [Spirochaeta cellobiosiphila]|uniref:nucleoside triphosphate pyrophosphohydrolase n=1 Tax=Spirochaeta cellobiosiphila TaxID=504483 RepID=UPI0004155576|nr:nucleoside triphosphate pyrophosphohydrolase [Spirochaeta cellobiosiphila]